VGRLIALVVFESFSGRPVLGFADIAQRFVRHLAPLAP
jgi:hypothetical protein